MAMGECSANSSLRADSKVKFADWPTSWRPPGADRISLRGPRVNSCILLRAKDDNTTNIVSELLLLFVPFEFSAVLVYLVQCLVF